MILKIKLNFIQSYALMILSLKKIKIFFEVSAQFMDQIYII